MDWLDDAIGFKPGTTERLLALLIVLALYFLVTRLSRLVTRWRTDDPAKRFVTGKVVTYVSAMVAIIVAARLWFGEFVGIIGYLGILSAGLAIALQKPLTNFAGWIYILWRKPFALGDRIQMGEHAGDVVDIRLFTFTMVEIRQWVGADQATGRILHVPNSWVFESVTCNYVQDFNYIWNELPVTVTSESNWEKAKGILSSIVERYCPVSQEQASQHIQLGMAGYTLRQDNLQPSVWTSLSPDGTVLTLRYLTNARNRRIIAAQIAEAILREFAQHVDIDMAYPTKRIFDNTREGKAGLDSSRIPLPGSQDRRVR